MGINSLEMLKVALENNEDIPEYSSEWYLPAFGGKKPADVSGIYSWDETRLLVENPDTGKLEIVRR